MSCLKHTFHSLHSFCDIEKELENRKKFKSYDIKIINFLIVASEANFAGECVVIGFERKNLVFFLNFYYTVDSLLKR